MSKVEHARAHETIYLLYIIVWGHLSFIQKHLLLWETEKEKEGNRRGGGWLRQLPTESGSLLSPLPLP